MNYTVRCWALWAIIGFISVSAIASEFEDWAETLEDVKRGKKKRPEECKEDKIAYLPINDAEAGPNTVGDMNGSPHLLHVAKRQTSGQNDKGQGTKLVYDYTFYTKKGNTFQDTTRNMCLYAHNYLRRKHDKTPTLEYDKDLEADAEKYAIYLAETGKFEHDHSISGTSGENLYRMSNTYDLVANPVHAVYGWYEESWLPLHGRPTDYDYTWNPTSSAEFSNAGVGHFTQLVWADTLKLGCGVATATFRYEGRVWRRTVVVSRYGPPGNWLGWFYNPKIGKQNVYPLEKRFEVATLEGLNRAKLHQKRAKCVNNLNTDECKMWKNTYNWCGYTWAQRDCTCQCG